ncbi:hypothetical protein [Paenibacillus aceris]|uniref:Uncharacterized protein n=1 Tax=Paenibacillus aceris TaxID=869555 RepID=A0ABS4HZK0_9BACL|nr:hypothetical protein [Paenibacillus aceris]MBP1964099.1 hypothetical protein [Paenibacillus aceris]NHW36438.1 hypothetical protein [Paenibacillus aceris]
MLRKLLQAFKWRKLRVRVWEKRLRQQLQFLSRRYSPAIPCKLHVSSGPFYGGSVMIDRQYRKAKINIHIPHDRYMTSDESQVLSRYPIMKNDLPYFILYHEFFHLIDALDHLRIHNEKNLDSYHSALKEAVQQATNYRNLDVEQRADDFAYQAYVEQCKKTG